ncbi:MAG TPA: alpha/beta fold hydrolase [Opitutaceae bacterium]|nr:alpha/beta fold hydrolase [Opitutaceae bacterium]
MPPTPIPPPVALAHRDFGGEGGPPRVILHGMLGSSRNWMTAGRELAARRRVFALDLRNHGRSPGAGAMSYEAMAGDVAAWLDARGIAAAELIGHSMGGKVAMLLACRHPERVGRLVVVDIAPRDYHWPERGAELRAMQGLDLATLGSLAQAEARIRAQVPDEATRKFLLTNLERLPEGGWRWQVNLEALVAALPALERNPLLPGDRFLGPALFIAGGNSRYVAPADNDAILRAFPGARIDVIAGCGHNPHVEAREAFVRALESAP